MGLTPEGVPTKANQNSIYSILNSLISIDGNLERTVPFKQIEKCINVYRSINIQLRERQVELILNELREKIKTVMTTQPKEQGEVVAGMPADEALHWLTIRICINNDIAKILNQEAAAPQSKKLSIQDRQVKFIETSLLWHCAALRHFTPEKLIEYYGQVRDTMFRRHTDSLTRQEFIDLVREVMYNRFPHISNSVRTALTNTVYPENASYLL